jgi:hypothetical protein
MNRRSLPTLAAAGVLAGSLTLLTGAPAGATTWYASCGPKINIRTGMSNIQTIREGGVLTGNQTYLVIKLNRGLKAGWGQTGIWWAKLQPGEGDIYIGDQANLNWTDYDPRDKASYCRDTVSKTEAFALTWGINAVPSGSNQWGHRLFAAYGRTQAFGYWTGHYADSIGNTPATDYVVSY